MRLATIKLGGAEVAGIVTEKGILPIHALNAAKGTAWKENLYDLIVEDQLKGLTNWYNEGGKEELAKIAGTVPYEKVEYAPLYRNPRRIFGIGLNYVDHAGDIGDAAPQGFPGSFFKMADTLIGPGDEIHMPALKEAQKTTAEAELGVILGKDCRDVSEENWLDAVAGYTTILDMTEESILKGNEFLKGNPRYLCIVKNFPTSFSFGPGSPERAQRRSLREERGRQHDPPPRPSGVPALQYPGLAGRRCSVHRYAPRLRSAGRRYCGMPHLRTRRLLHGTAGKPGSRPQEAP